MPRIPRGNGRANRRKVDLPEDAGFGGEQVPEFHGSLTVEAAAEETPPELLALGLPPADAAGIQKWNYQVLSTMAALELRNTKISAEDRMRRVAKLTTAASRHYPEAAKYDLAKKIDDDNETLTTRKRAKAAAELERRPAAGGAKVIPIRRDAPRS